MPPISRASAGVGGERAHEARGPGRTREGGGVPDRPELPDRPERVADVVGRVARQALVDRAASGIALIDDGGPEAALAADWLAASLHDGAVIRVSEPHRALEPLLQLGDDEADALQPRIEALRTTARLIAGALVANPVNRTVVLLSGSPPPDPFLPLADLLASQVEELAGGWSGPAEVVALAEACGGIRELDAALHAHLDGRDPRALDALPAGAARAVRDALRSGRAARRAAWLVPKIGYRTLGVDLFE